MTLVTRHLVVWCGIIGSLLIPDNGYAQAYEGKPCHAGRLASALATPLQVGQTFTLGEDVGFAAYNRWASSALPPSGSKPARQRNNPTMEQEAADAEARDRWSCQYSAASVHDGASTTAWCEGVAGPGTNETVIAQVIPGKPVQIWAGYGKSAATFRANHRPKQVRVARLHTKPFSGFSSSEGWGPGSAPVVVQAVHTVTLQDRNGYQPLPLPTSPTDTTLLAVQIIDTYPGAQFADTCISEIRTP